ncbi:class I SAM-dependent methyltransferase [Erwinia phyllosphaerae]|uniref:class I SAM-dependent methyltransferase n=1 Tax=Erwinia phyllosphaerae TaxID=2853256 RepID=UPI001FEEBA76|nr:class I SAM-dependent methyltransferase [Erwinia phyllosphaerae]MBV4368448.1 class I SAM-dependent methyltransferase [Erwinia phyllosphaerae]
MKNSHEVLVESQFGDQAQAYLDSTVHAQGADLQRLVQWLSDDAQATLLDIGCGAGHASFAAASRVAQVTAYDLSEKMLKVVSEAAAERGLHNLTTAHGPAEALPFAAASFDIVISRYSAHHWHDVGMALREVKRVLKPDGKFILMDIASPGLPILDVWLQTVEMLRDPSHVRDYSQGEWLSMVNESGMAVNRLAVDRLDLEFSSWIERMQTPDELTQAIRLLQAKASDSVKHHYAIQPDGSFSTDTIMFQAG